MSRAAWIVWLSLVASSASAATRVAPGVDLVPGAFVAGTQPDGNTIVFEARDGLIVFDTGRHREHAQKIVDLAAARGRPIAAIVNSHWHLDHVGGNPRIRAAFPDLRVYASGAIEDAMGGFLANYRAQLVQAIAGANGDAVKIAPWQAEIALIDSGRALYPDQRIAATSTRTIAGRRVRVGLETRAVTAGDVWLFDPATRVLASGDLVTLPAPLFDTACPSRWKKALAHLDAIDFATLVPGHGAPMQRRDFERYRTAFARLLTCADATTDNTRCIDGWMRDAGPLIPESDRALAPSLLDYYLKASLRGDAATRNCR